MILWGQSLLNACRFPDFVFEGGIQKEIGLLFHNRDTIHHVSFHEYSYSEITNFRKACKKTVDPINYEMKYRKASWRRYCANFRFYIKFEINRSFVSIQISLVLTAKGFRFKEFNIPQFYCAKQKKFCKPYLSRTVVYTFIPFSVNQITTVGST